MSDQIDPAFKAAYRETQGQPVDAVGRQFDAHMNGEERALRNDTRPIVAAQQDGGLVERLKDVSTRMSGHVDAGDVWDAATALAEKDARIAELDAECQQSMLDICRERERAEKAGAQLTTSRAECEGLRAALGEVCSEGRILSGGIRRPAKWISIPGEVFARARAALSQKETGDE